MIRLRTATKWRLAQRATTFMVVWAVCIALQVIAIVLLKEFGGAIANGAVMLFYTPAGFLVGWWNPVRDPNELLRFYVETVMTGIVLYGAIGGSVGAVVLPKFSWKGGRE